MSLVLLNLFPCAPFATESAVHLCSSLSALASPCLDFWILPPPPQLQLWTIDLFHYHPPAVFVFCILGPLRKQIITTALWMWSSSRDDFVKLCLKSRLNFYGNPFWSWKDSGTFIVLVPGYKWSTVLTWCVFDQIWYMLPSTKYSSEKVFADLLSSNPYSLFCKML